MGGLRRRSLLAARVRSQIRTAHTSFAARCQDQHQGHRLTSAPIFGKTMPRRGEMTYLYSEALRIAAAIVHLTFNGISTPGMLYSAAATDIMVLHS